MWLTVLILSLVSALVSSQNDGLANSSFDDLLNTLPGASDPPTGGLDPCCVKPEECINGQVATAGQGRFIYRNVVCPDGYVCCDVPGASTVAPTPSTAAPPLPPLPSSSTVSPPLPSSSTVSPLQSSSLAPPTPILPNDTTCGIRQDNIFRRSQDPQRPDSEEFPWTVAIFTKQNMVYKCGGSIIHPRAVLTVAHYFKRSQPSELRIRVGNWDLTDDYELFPYQESDVSEIVSHESFNSGKKAYDVALLFLTTTINPKRNVRFACLPPAGTVTPPSTRCIVSGWGMPNLGGQLETIQKMVTLPIVEFQTCQTALRAAVENPRYRLSESLICAGGEAGIDTCKGDGGAPLVCPYSPNSPRYYQAGITSWGLDCGLAGVPSAYTSVAVVRGWIDTKMAARRYGAESYTAPQQ